MSLLTEYVREIRHFQRNAGLYLVSNGLSGVTTGIILVLYNLYLVSLGYNTDFIGLVLFAVTLGAGLAIFPAGLCIDRFSGKAILIWSSVAIGIAGAGQILLRQPIPLLISGFLVGISAAFILVVNAPFLTLNSTPAERALLFSLNIVLSLATTVIGELLGGVLPLWFRANLWLVNVLPEWFRGVLASDPTSRSYQLSLLLAGVIAAPSFIPLFLMSDDPPRTAHAVEGQERSWLQNVRETLQRWRKISLREIVFSPLFALVLVQTLVGLGAGFFIPYFNVYFVTHLGASPALFGVIDGGANTLNAVLTLTAPWLSVRIGKINTIALTRLIGVFLLLMIGLTNLLPLAALLYLFRQGTTEMSAGIFQVFSMEEVPKRHRGLANSLYQGTFQGAWAVTTPLGGLIIARLGYPPVFIVGAVLYVLAVVTLWGRFGRSTSVPGEDSPVRSGDLVATEQRHDSPKID